jgi:exonuclease SbcD
MRILHTADWHLGDRLGRIDRTADLRRSVERLATYCDTERADVLLVAGDLFSELSRPDSLRESVEHLQEVFLPFLRRGGTFLALTGNHDNENFCQTLRHAMALAAPDATEPGAVLAPGRVHFASTPSLLRLPGPAAEVVQFLLMPYPTPSRYLDVRAQRYRSLEEKNRALQAAYLTRLRALQQDPAFDPRLPTVLAAHIHVKSARLPGAFRISERETILFGDEDLPPEYAYVALGHIHQPQCLGGLAHHRYSGSIERLDLGEQGDEKGAVLVEVGPDGRRGEPVWLPLEATPIYDLHIENPAAELPTLPDRYPDAERALVRYHVTYRAGTDNLEETLRQLDRIFPRWYDRDWTEAGALGDGRATLASPAQPRSFSEIVRDYLTAELAEHADREVLLELAEELLTEERA